MRGMLENLIHIRMKINYKYKIHIPLPLWSNERLVKALKKDVSLKYIFVKNAGKYKEKCENDSKFHHPHKVWWSPKVKYIPTIRISKQVRKEHDAEKCYVWSLFTSMFSVILPEAYYVFASTYMPEWTHTCVHAYTYTHINCRKRI